MTATKRLLPLLLLIAAPAFADFRAVETQLRSQLGRPVYIPFLGVARFATWFVHPHGVHDFQVATWEQHKHLDGAELERSLRDGLAKDFQPLVRVTGRREWTFIYARPVGDRFEIIVLNHDHSDTVLVRADIDGEELSKTMSNRRMARVHVAAR
jgi:hypothetical protein